MKIQYMSDLHMELLENSRYIKAKEFDVVGDVLVLAGDTFYLRDIIAPQKRFWNWASENFRQVLLVPGNHEFYNDGDVTERGDSWQWMFRENVGYYYNKVVRIDDTDFILTTLWSKIPVQYMYHVHWGMNDFRQIMYDGRRFQPEDFNAEHEKCLKFLKQAVNESTAKHIVVVTHHLPTLKVVAAQHQGSFLNGAFAVTVSRNHHISPQIFAGLRGIVNHLSEDCGNATKMLEFFHKCFIALCHLHIVFILHG